MIARQSTFLTASGVGNGPRLRVTFRSWALERIKELAAQHVRWGSGMIHGLLVREGWAVNRKRVQRRYQEEGLAVRRKGKRRRSQRPRLERQPLGGVDER